MSTTDSNPVQLSSPEHLQQLAPQDADTAVSALKIAAGDNLSGAELGKQRAAHRAIDENVHDNMVLGIGSGSTVVYAVERIAVLRKQNNWKNIVCIPTSFQSEQLIIAGELQYGKLDHYQRLDLTIDGADECDSELNCIKGGGACQLQEKIIASNSKKFIVIADSRKNSTKLGQQWKKGVPIEVIPDAHQPIIRTIKEKLNGKVTLRISPPGGKAGPVITDNGNFVIDADFGVIEPQNVAKLNRQLSSIAGVVETGLFINMASKAYFGDEKGEVQIRENSRAQPMALFD